MFMNRFPLASWLFWRTIATVMLSVGTTVTGINTVASYPIAAARNNTNCATTYTIKPGDDLYRIALADATTWQTLEQLNAIYDPSKIFVGQVLCLPNQIAGAPFSIAPVSGVTVTNPQAVTVPQTTVNVVIGRNINGSTINSLGQVEFLGGSGSCGFQTNGGGDGILQLPVTGFVITRLFSAWHSGIDLAKPLGTPIDAAGSGTVVFAGWSTWGYGNSIVIAHTATLMTLYGHLSQINVHCGETVDRGQLIGLVGMTGWANGPHLHFEIRINEVPVNPTTALTF